MEIHLAYNSADLQLPIVPDKFEVSDKQNNEVTTIQNTGEINLLGKTGLREIELTSSFPGSQNKARRYVSVKDPEDPETYISKLKNWKDSDSVIDLHITDTNIAWPVTIEELKYSREDASGDYNYTINLKEYKKAAGRITKKTVTTKYTVKKGDKLKKLAYKYLGATKYSSTIYTQNKNAIEKAWTKYRNKKNKEIKAYNRHHSKKKALIKDRTSKKGAHLVKGTKLVIKSGVIT